MSVPSWLKWPPNCCESCTGWQQDKADRWIGHCRNAEALDCNTATDARYRCPSFQRKQEAA